MSRLAQLGILSVGLGAVVLFLGLFPNAIGVTGTVGIGLAQIALILVGLTLLIFGAYVVVFAEWHRGRERLDGALGLLRSVGLRLGFTGLVLAYGATLADVFGFGSHSGSEGVLLGWLQAAGMLMGFFIAALGVIVYGWIGFTSGDAL